jgi:hypothetical protein
MHVEKSLDQLLPHLIHSYAVCIILGRLKTAISLDSIKRNLHFRTSYRLINNSH